jgi:hypothetical protein
MKHCTIHPIAIYFVSKRLKKPTKAQKLDMRHQYLLVWVKLKNRDSMISKNEIFIICGDKIYCNTIQPK